MITLNENYQKNIEILKENIKRGMTSKQALQVIENMENTFINAGLYNEEEKQYIQDMRDIVSIKATDLMKNIGVEVININ